MSLFFTRRHMLGLMASGAVIGSGLSREAVGLEKGGAPYLDIRPGASFRPITLAITGFVGDADHANNLTNILRNNFARSVFIQALDPKTFIATSTTPDQPPQFEAWKAINADCVVMGRIVRTAEGRLKSEFRLWDVSSGQQIAGQQYMTDANNARRVGHIISDAIFTRLTGEKGWFDTRVAFVEESGPKENRIKRLALMDQDGANVRLLTRGDELVVTPRFSPSAQEITYMGFGQGDPKVYVLNIETGQREVVGNFPGMTFSPRFSPDGQKVVMSLAQKTASNLFVMDLRSRTTTRLTDTAAIDTSPCYSPDGGRLVFESDRGGSQQLYIMPATGGTAQRLSYKEGSRYSTPVWSPRGDYIAFTRQSGGQFAIGIMKPDGSGERILTEGFHNEAPTWAPNGLYLMFFRDPGGQEGPRIFMCDLFGRGEFPVPTNGFASDPSWSTLLS